METQSASKPGASPGMQVIHYTRRERYTILFFAFVGTIFDGADYSIFIQFIVPISKYFQTSFTSIMVIQSASYLTGIAGGILFGHLADRYGRRLGLSVTVALFSLGTLASALSPNYTWLLIFRIVTGLGIGGESGIAYAYLNEAWPSKRRGAVNSLMHCMFIVGSFISIVLYKVTVIRYGANAWQYAFAYLGAIAVLGALIRIFMPESKMWLALKEQGSKAALVRTSIKDLFAPELRRTTILMLFVITGGFFGSYSVITFGPSTWIGIYKIGPANFAIIGYWATLATMSAYFLSGSISDKVGRKRAYMTAALVGTAGYLFFGLLLRLGVHATNETAIGSLLFFSYLWMQAGYGYSGVQGVWLSELFPTSVRAKGVNFVYYMGRAIGAGLGPLVSLLIAQKLGGDARLAMAFGFVGTLMAATFARLVPETRGKTLKQTVDEKEGKVSVS